MIHLHCVVRMQLLSYSCFLSVDKPTIKEKMPQWVPLFDGYQEVLVCEATGYPKPTITWIFNNDRLEAGNMTVIKNAGEYTCIASNSVGNDTRVVTVVLKGNNTLYSNLYHTS